MGIVCLLSALRFYDLTTQAPSEVWLALPAGTSGASEVRRTPPDSPPLHIVRFSGQAFTEGVEEHIVETVPVRVYTPAKTVADCFRYRNKIGLDVALEALRETWRARRALHVTMDDMWRYAEICHVTTVMRPYLEALVAFESL